MTRLHAVTAIVTLLVSAALVVAGLNNSGSKIYVGINLAGGFAIAVIAFISFFVAHQHQRKSARNYFALQFICALAVAFIPANHSSHMVTHTKRELEAIYDTLAKNGPPFPARDDEPFGPLINGKRIFPSGYWAPPDRQTFEVYYRIDSNSWALEYPERTWGRRQDFHSWPEEPKRVPKRRRTVTP